MSRNATTLPEFLWLFAATVIMRRTAGVAFSALAMIVYTVQLDLGQVAADRINFAFGDCGCYDNAGSYGLTVSTQAASACAD
jgi:hypothetical protein